MNKRERHFLYKQKAIDIILSSFRVKTKTIGYRKKLQQGLLSNRKVRGERYGEPGIQKDCDWGDHNGRSKEVKEKLLQIKKKKKKNRAAR